MRNLMFGSSLVLFATVGCGGDSGNKIHVPDAKVYLDAGIDAPPQCSVVNPIGSLTLGTSAAPAEDDWFYTPTTGANMGKKSFEIFAGLPASTTLPNAPGTTDALLVQVFKPTAGFALNAPYAFELDPNAMTYSAASFVFGDYDSNAQTLQNFYWPTNGTVTFTAIGETDGSLITGTTTMTMLHELDDMNNVVPNGCTTAYTLSFNLKQKAAPPPPRTAEPSKQQLVDSMLVKRAQQQTHQ